MRLSIGLLAFFTLACALGAEDKDTGSECAASTEVCNGVDDDCDGSIDEDASDIGTWYADDDADSYGDLAEPLVECEAPAGFVADGTDCNDDDPAINPGAAEGGGNEVDENCDGVIDETCGGNAPVVTITDSDYDPSYDFGGSDKPALILDLDITDADGDLWEITTSLWIEDDGDGTVDTSGEADHDFSPFTFDDDDDTCDETDNSIRYALEASNYDDASVLDVGVIVEDAGEHPSEVAVVVIEVGG